MLEKYEMLNQERKNLIRKERSLHTVVFPQTMKTKQIRLKVSNDILSNILNIIPIGSFTKYLRMRASLVRTQKRENSLTV